MITLKTGLTLLLSLSAVAQANDSVVRLTELNCATFKSAMLIGQVLPDVPIVSEADFHARQKPRYFGGSLLSDGVLAIDSWKLCDRLIEALTIRVSDSGRKVLDVVEDTYKAKHIRPLVSGGDLGCKRGKVVLPDVLAFVDAAKETEWFSAKKVFLIDLKARKFNEASAKDVRCQNISYGE